LRFSKWTLSVVLTLFSYCTRSHSTPNCMHLWSGPLLNHDQAFRWSSSHFVVGETLYRLKSRVLCLQFHEAFTTHFSPHQFGVTIKGGCEIIIHGIKCTLDLHPIWVVLQLDVANTFNSMSRKVIMWGHHTNHPLYLCILCIRISFTLQSS
jgi:hypothetical protein